MLNSTSARASGEGGEQEQIPPQSCGAVRVRSSRMPALLCLAAAVLIFWNCFFPQPLRAQAVKGLSKEDIIKLINAEVASKRIEALVEERGISFELTAQAEQELRRAGASSDLIEVVRAHSRPPAPAELVVESKPGGADIFVDSQFQAKTSSGGWAKISPLAPGRHNLRISAPGFDDFIQAIDLKSGETFSVNATLTRTKEPSPILFVNSNPAGAMVHVDGKLMGGTGAVGRLKISDLEPGKHVVRVSAEGYVDFEQSVEVASGKALTVTTVLERPKPVTAVLVLESVLRGATVTVDGRLVDQSSPGGSLNIPDLVPGKHRVQVAADGYAPFDQTVDLGAGSVLTLRTPLLPLAPSPGHARANPIDGLKYVWIPPGSFMMGCSPADSMCSGNELPSHPVTVSKGFWLGQTEVTVGAYKRFASSTGRSMPDEPAFKTSPLNPGWNNKRMPMVNMTWHDAVAYCRWAGGRLPSEAEWELAARAGSSEARYGLVSEVAWYNKNSANRPHEVGQKGPNALNLFDTLGNVWEWVSDWYDEKYYAGSPERDPQGPASGEYRALRGASWLNDPRGTRVSSRGWDRHSSSGIIYGFRCVRDAPP